MSGACFCQSSGTSNHCCLKIICLAMTCTSSFLHYLWVPRQSPFAHVFSVLILFYRGCIFLAPGFPLCFLDLGFLKTGLISKDWSEKGIHYLDFLFSNTYLFPSLPFVTYILLEALLAAFDNPSQIEFHLGFGSSHSYMPRQSVCIPPKSYIPHKTCIYVAK